MDRLGFKRRSSIGVDGLKAIDDEDPMAAINQAVNDMDWGGVDAESSSDSEEDFEVKNNVQLELDVEFSAIVIEFNKERNNGLEVMKLELDEILITN